MESMSLGFNKFPSKGSKNKLPSLKEFRREGGSKEKKKFDPLLTKQKLILMSRSYSVANMTFEKVNLKTCKTTQPKFSYPTRYDTEKYNNKTLLNIKKNFNLFSNNNRSCDSFRPRNGSFDSHNIPRLNNSNSMIKLKDIKDTSEITNFHYDKIMNSVRGFKQHRVNKTEIKFDLEKICEKEKEKTQRVIFNNTNNNYLARFKLPKLSSISIQPKLLLSKSPPNKKIMGERYNPFNNEPFRKNMQVRNYHGGLYPY